MSNMKNDNSNKFKRGKGGENMLRELVRNTTQLEEQSKLSPVDQALEQFKKDNGYDFMDFLNDDRIQRKHIIMQHQKPNYDDDEFLKKFQEYQCKQEE